MQSSALWQGNVGGGCPSGHRAIGGDDGLTAHYLQGPRDDRSAAGYAAVESDDCDGIGRD